MARAGLARAAVTLILLSSIFSVWFTFNNFQQPAYAAESQKTWAKTYGLAPDDYLSSISETKDGGYVLAGSAGSSDVTEFDGWILKLDSDGNIEWQKTYGAGDGRDEFWGSIQQTSDGGYITIGTIFIGSCCLGGKSLVLKLDSEGNIEWEKTYDGAVLRLNSSGGVELVKSFNSGSSDFKAVPSSIQETSDGGFIVAGIMIQYSTNSIDAWLLKLDPAGNIEWQKSYASYLSDVFESIQQTTDGGYLVTGSTGIGGGSNPDAWLLKLDSDGNVEWQKSYGGADTDLAHSIQQTPDGGYIMLVETYSFGGGADPWLFKLNSDGIIEWEKVYLGGFGFPIGFLQTSDGGYIVAGSNGDFWLLKLDSEGKINNCSSVEIQDTNASVKDTAVPSGNSTISVNEGSAVIEDANLAANETSSKVGVRCESTSVFSLELFEGTNPSDLILDLGQEARVVANTTDPLVSQVNFTWNNPSGEPVHTELVPLLTGQAEGTFKPDAVGRWTVVADFGNGVVKQQTFDVRLLVIPESPIGTLALIASSMTALTLYGIRGIHRRKQGK